MFLLSSRGIRHEQTQEQEVEKSTWNACSENEKRSHRCHLSPPGLRQLAKGIHRSFSIPFFRYSMAVALFLLLEGFCSTSLCAISQPIVRCLPYYYLGCSLAISPGILACIFRRWSGLPSYLSSSAMIDSVYQLMSPASRPLLPRIVCLPLPTGQKNRPRCPAWPQWRRNSTDNNTTHPTLCISQTLLLPRFRQRGHHCRKRPTEKDHQALPP